MASVKAGFKRPSCSNNHQGLIKISKFTDVDCKRLCGFNTKELLDAVSLQDSALLQGDVSDVDSLLARWWRRRSRDGTTVQSNISAVSPRTRIRYISRYAWAKGEYRICLYYIDL